MSKLKDLTIDSELEQINLAYEEGLLSEVEFDRLQRKYLRELFLQGHDCEYETGQLDPSCSHPSHDTI